MALTGSTSAPAHVAGVQVIHPITRLIVGGAQQNTMETCARLDSGRYRARILAGPETGSEGELVSEIRRRRIPLTILPEMVRAPHPLRDYGALRRMERFFRESGPHIVHTHSSKAGILGRWAARKARVPVIVHTVHGWGHHQYQNVFTRNVFRFLERNTAGITDKLIVVSQVNARRGLRDRIGQPRQYTTIHSCIDLDEFLPDPHTRGQLRQQLGIAADRLVVGTVGRLSPQKNPFDFVRVAAAVKRQVPGVQFLFVGDGPLRSATQRLIRESGLEADVLLPGLRRDIPALLRCMDVFILTSLWEGLPRVIPQAMAAGLPVAVNAVDGVCEAVQEGENGFLIQPRDVAGMARAIFRLLMDPVLRTRMGEAGRLKARQEFSLTDMIHSIEGLYEELLRSKAVPV